VVNGAAGWGGGAGRRRRVAQLPGSPRPRSIDQNQRWQQHDYHHLDQRQRSSAHVHSIARRFAPKSSDLIPILVFIFQLFILELIHSEIHCSLLII
jgi:hypothetical protein